MSDEKEQPEENWWETDMENGILQSFVRRYSDRIEFYFSPIVIKGDPNKLDFKKGVSPEELSFVSYGKGGPRYITCLSMEEVRIKMDIMHPGCKIIKYVASKDRYFEYDLTLEESDG